MLKRSAHAPSTASSQERGNKAKRKDTEKLTLDKVFGVTSLNNASFVASASGILFYSAGSVVVAYNPISNRQISYYHAIKPISCIAVSPDEHYLAIGERGNVPSVIIYDIQTNTKLASLNGHQYGISCACFSHDSKYLISIGFKHDKQLVLWNWCTESKICAHKIENKVSSISCHEDGKFFVTAGEQHLKWWFKAMDGDGNISGLVGKPASILDHQKDYVFVDVLCGKKEFRNTIYALTKLGVLCSFHETRILEKWVQLETSSAYCLTSYLNYVLIGCANGQSIVLSTSTLDFVSNLPLPLPLVSSSSQNNMYPACYAMQYIPTVPYVAFLYADRSMYFIDVGLNFSNITKLRLFSYHSSCVWDVLNIEGEFDKDKRVIENELQKDSNPNMVTGLPFGTFVTCGADNTLRFWNCDPRSQRKSKWRSPHSRDLLYTINVPHVETDEDRRLHIDICTAHPDPELPDRQQGSNIIRCMSFHPNGIDIACGSKMGLLFVYDLRTMKPAEAIRSWKTPVHDSEIMTLSFSPRIFHPESQRDIVFLASGGKDRLVHVFDATDLTDSHKRYQLITTLDGHSASVMSVKFTPDGQRLITCGGDKMMAIYKLNGSIFTRHKLIPTPNGVINGLAIDIATNKYAVSSGKDKKINVWNIHSGKILRSYKPQGMDTEIYKSCLDPSGMFVGTSSFDKVIRLFDFFSGDLLTQVTGHSDLITNVQFSSDGKSFYSIAGDGCVFVWAVCQELIEAMQERLLELYATAQRKQQEKAARNYEANPKSLSSEQAKIESQSALSVVESKIISKLPQWAVHPSESTEKTIVESDKGAGQILKSKWNGKNPNSTDKIEIFGKVLKRGKERNKLTIDLSNNDEDYITANDGFVSPSKLASKLNVHEEHDSVVIEACHESEEHHESEYCSSEEENANTKDDGISDDSINKAMTDIDALAMSAIKLEGFLEDMIVNESSENRHDTSESSRAVLGSSLSSDFFQRLKVDNLPKKAYETEDSILPPPPYMEVSGQAEQNSSSGGGILTYSDATYAKRVETASAIAQMRERLRCMGILEQADQRQSTNDPTHEDSEVVNETDNAEVEFVDIAHAPPLPPDCECHDNEDADSTCSTISGGSGIEGSGVRQESKDNEDSELESYEQILNELNAVSKRAMQAYNKLLSKRFNDTEKEEGIVISSFSESSILPEQASTGTFANPKVQTLLNNFRSSFASINTMTEDIVNIQQTARTDNLTESITDLGRSQNVISPSTSSADVTAILEKYSDQLAKMVSAKLSTTQT